MGYVAGMGARVVWHCRGLRSQRRILSRSEKRPERKITKNTQWIGPAAGPPSPYRLMCAYTRELHTRAGDGDTAGARPPPGPQDLAAFTPSHSRPTLKTQNHPSRARREIGVMQQVRDAAGGSWVSSTGGRHRRPA